MLKHNTENEKHLLGCYLQGGAIGNTITTDIFSTISHKNIFKTIQDLRSQGVTVDLAVLVPELERQGKLADCGSAAAIAEFTNVPLVSNTAFYESEVLKECQRRILWQAVSYAKEGLEHGEDVETIRSSMFDDVMQHTAHNKPEGILFKDLMTKQFPDDDFLIEGLLSPGLTVVTGASKIGKSWLALQLVTALDQGGSFLGQLKARKCNVLYLALEDTPKRVQRRLKKQDCIEFNNSRLETKRMTDLELRCLLKDRQYGAVIIDTLQKYKGISDLNDYSQTVNGLSTLKDIADGLGIALIVIHHNRKNADGDQDHLHSALGSTGINATADCTLTLKRKRGDAKATMLVSGRDIEDASYTLAWDKDCCSWTITESGAIKPAIPEAQQQILDLLESEDRAWYTWEIVAKTEKSKQAVNSILSRMKENGMIKSPNIGLWQTVNGKHSLRESIPVYQDQDAETPKETGETELELF